MCNIRILYVGYIMFRSDAALWSVSTCSFTVSFHFFHPLSPWYLLADFLYTNHRLTGVYKFNIYIATRTATVHTRPNLYEKHTSITTYYVLLINSWLIFVHIDSFYQSQQRMSVTPHKALSLTAFAV